MEKNGKNIVAISCPNYEELKKQARNERTYREPGVKKIVRTACRETGCDWSDYRLRKYVENIFNFDDGTPYEKKKNVKAKIKTLQL